MLFSSLIFIGQICLISGAPGSLLMGGRGGTPGETHLTVGNQHERRHEARKVEPRKEYREISSASYPIEKQDYYNFDNEYDFSGEDESLRHGKTPSFDAPSDFKSNFGNFDDFLKGFEGSSKGFANFLNTVNLNSFRESSGGFSNVGKEQEYDGDTYGYQPEERPKFIRPEPVYIPKEEPEENDHFGFEDENADFRYKEESLIPEFEASSHSFEKYPQREQENEFDDFEQDSNYPKSEYEDSLKQIRPQDFQDSIQFQQDHHSSFHGSTPYNQPQNVQKYHPKESSNIGEESSPAIFNPNDLKKNHIIRPIQTKQPVYPENNFRNPVKTLPSNNHQSHQLIRIPSIDDRFRPIVEDSVPDFTGFDNSQEIITAPPFPKRRFVNSQRGQTFDVKLGAGFNTRDGEPLDTKSYEPITHFSKK